MPPQRKTITGKRKKSETKARIATPPQTIVEDTEYDEDDDVVIDEMTTDEEREAIKAKLELMRASGDDGISLYQHLAELLTTLLSDQPNTAIDTLEKMSGRLKVERMSSFHGIKVVSGQPEREELFQNEWKLFKTIGRQPMITTRVTSLATTVLLPEDTQQKLALLPDLMRQCYMFNMAGYGLPASEYTRLTLSMRELVQDWPLKSIRFWGKILGTEKNYYVVETEFLEGEYNTDVTDDEADDVIKDSTSKHSQETDSLSKDISIFNGDDDDDDDDDDDEVPVMYRPPTKIPCEDPGFGTNLKVYFVCTEPGLPWHRLPHVTPDQIVQARQVRAYFTGNLQHVHATFPPFPGKEANYLRAQIARITSSTSVSPIGYFKFDEEGEEEEEHSEPRDACVKDEDFDGVSTRDLADPSLQYWVHHANYILPQGRTVWYNPLNARRGGRGDEGEDEEEGDEEEDRNEPDEPEPQLPQPLLVPISEDVEVGGSPAWVCRMTSLYVPEHSPVALVSFRWPGAVTVATDRGKFFENLYVGYGQKELGDDFDPALPGDPRMEFPTGPEIMEQDDPTPGEEAAVKAALREQEEMIKMREGEEDEDDEDEDDEEGEEENEDDD